MKYKVLIIDAGATISARLAGVLRTEGYEITYAFGGVTALTDFMEADIDLVLLHLQAPAKADWKALEEITTTNPPLPLIVIAGPSARILPAWVSDVCTLVKTPIQVPSLLETMSRVAADVKVARKTQSPAVVPWSANQSAMRNAAQAYEEVEQVTKLVSGTPLKKVTHGCPLRADRLQALRRVWNRCSVAEQQFFMQEIAAVSCARDFFL